MKTNTIGSFQEIYSILSSSDNSNNCALVSLSLPSICQRVNIKSFLCHLGRILCIVTVSTDLTSFLEATIEDFEAVDGLGELQCKGEKMDFRRNT
jgi:hypothetical protein